MIAATGRLYPYRMEPLEKPAIWGGHALVERYGKIGDPALALGESWECWDENRVDNGSLRGLSLAQLRHELGADLMGPLNAAQSFPVLTKIIDAHAALSVQVHPSDEYAQRVEGQPNGKTECWFILAAQPGAELVLGWTRDTDRAEYERRVADGTLGDILRRVPVCAGEVYYLKAGTLHAIGAGIELFETQQTSDLTYRIFDWNRVGSDGKPRELHVAKAGDVLDFRGISQGAVSSLSFPQIGAERSFLVADANFCLERLQVDVAGTQVATNGLPLTITALATDLDVQCGTVFTAIAPYASIVVPAAAEVCTLGSPGSVLLVRPRASHAQLRADALRGGVAPVDVDAFFAQFA